MSIQSRQNELARLQRDLASLRTQDASEAKKEASIAKNIEQVSRSLSNTRSESIAQTYSQKRVRLSEDAAKVQTKRADIGKKIAAKMTKLHQAEQALSKEDERERKKVIEADKKREREQLEYQRKLTRELNAQRTAATSFTNFSQTQPTVKKTHDAFISHASEDKEGFVRPLAEALQAEGFDIWYDEFSLTVGDSLRQNIDKGLASSRFGIVVLSSAFFSKNWPQYELNGLVAKEMEGRKVVLPIWHKVSKDEVMAFSPPMSDKVAINTAISSLPEVIAQLSEVLRK